MPQEKKLEMPAMQTKQASEMGQREDLGPNVSPEIAQDFKNVDEKIDQLPAQEKSEEELRADINHYREQIKLGETKDANGKYNEQLVLENEAKLREAEKLLIGKKQEAEKEDQIAAIRKEIEGYRENIKTGESKDANGKYNEQLVLENEAKLRQAEQKMAALKQTKETESMTAPEQTNEVKPTAPVKKKKKGFFARLFGLERKDTAI